MFTIQILIAVGVVVGVAVAWTMAAMIAGAIWRRDHARVARSARAATASAQAEDMRELVLR
jgi:Alphavirus glycoprotein J